MMNETWARLAGFLTVLVVMVVWETLIPNRTSTVKKGRRWLSNFGLIFLGALAARLVAPAGLAAFSLYAQHHQFGLWNNIELSLWLTVPATIILLDWLIYWQHRLFHNVPALWRLHRVHHADPHIDVTTGLRFHPLEIALSLAIKVIAVLILGAPLLAILLFEVLLNASSMFNHANIKLSEKVDHNLRKVIVTQAMHRIHHSQLAKETNSNYGFNLSIWDRLFGSYTAQAKHGDEAIKLGLKEYSTRQTNTDLLALLLMPFRRK